VCSAAALALLGAHGASASAGEARPAGARFPELAPDLAVELLDNGDFAEPLSTAPDRAGLVPWWRVTGAARVDFGGAAGATGAAAAELVLAPGARADQPVALAAAHARDFVLRGLAAGPALVTLRQGDGQALSAAVGGGAALAPFELDAEDLVGPPGESGSPRYVLELGVDERTSGGADARFAALSFEVRLPCPGEAQLRADLTRDLDELFGAWLAHALDRRGPRATAFVAASFDAASGAPAAPYERAAAVHPLYVELLDAWAVEPRAAWAAALEALLADFLELALDPRTGLPRMWDPGRDEPLDQALEVALWLRFLADAAERGPPEMRPRCRAAALAIGEHVLARGRRPDGSIAPIYRPSDGAPSDDAVDLRRLDVAAELARLGAWTGDSRFGEAARAALFELEFALYWPGTWDGIDPGFDDRYGHFGARAVELARALPHEPAFLRLADRGFERYAPLWTDALRFGGNVAADQTRCWRIAADLAELEPSWRAMVDGLLAAAGDVHVKGMQWGSGEWIDATVKGFDLRELPVGDTGGVPRNLLEGLAVLYRPGLATRSDRTRALFWSVLESTRDRHRRALGYVAGGRAGSTADGTLYVLPGLVEMLGNLTP
jgi:hypothetical protein